MKTIKRRWKLILAGAAALCLVLGMAGLFGHLAGRAAASGIPKTDPLYYSGVLADTSGKLLSGSYTVAVDLYTAATGGTKACTTAGKSATVTQGRFRVALSATCVTAIRTYPDLWVEVTVGSTKMPRQKIGAVPYAVEAQAQAAADPDCPPGYVKDTAAAGITLCKRGKDEMVKVGDFWVDRYEASIVDGTTWNSGTCNGFGTGYGAAVDNYPSTFPDSAKATTKLYACSRSGNLPSASMTWFQAAAACAFAGKHLCTNGEWQVAAFGTPDDSVSCNISTSAAEKAGSRSACISQFGVFDMVGNLFEWVDMWGQAGKSWVASDGETATPWPSSGGYGDGKDLTWNLNGRAANPTWMNGSPFAALRGGQYLNGTDAGVFALRFDHGPSSMGTYLGARCCRQ